MQEVSESKNRLKIAPAKMSNNNHPLYWFQLYDSDTGLPFKETTASSISGSSLEYPMIDQFRDAVKRKYKDDDSAILTGIASSQLLVYRNKAAFDRRDLPEEKVMNHMLILGRAS